MNVCKLSLTDPAGAVFCTGLHVLWLDSVVVQIYTHLYMHLQVYQCRYLYDIQEVKSIIVLDDVISEVKAAHGLPLPLQLTLWFIGQQGYNVGS